MAVELTANAAQTVAAGQNVLFTDTPVGCNRGYVVHREGAGLVTLRGTCNGCSTFARYKVLFAGNISVPAGGTVEAISVALSLGGEAIQQTTATVTPAQSGTPLTWQRLRLWTFPGAAAQAWHSETFPLRPSVLRMPT